MLRKPIKQNTTSLERTLGTMNGMILEGNITTHETPLFTLPHYSERNAEIIGTLEEEAKKYEREIRKIERREMYYKGLAHSLAPAASACATGAGIAFGIGTYSVINFIGNQQAAMTVGGLFGFISAFMGGAMTYMFDPTDPMRKILIGRAERLQNKKNLHATRLADVENLLKEAYICKEESPDIAYIIVGEDSTRRFQEDTSTYELNVYKMGNVSIEGQFAEKARTVNNPLQLLTEMAIAPQKQAAVIIADIEHAQRLIPNAADGDIIMLRYDPGNAVWMHTGRFPARHYERDIPIAPTDEQSNYRT